MFNLNVCPRSFQISALKYKIVSSRRSRHQKMIISNSPLKTQKQKDFPFYILIGFKTLVIKWPSFFVYANEHLKGMGWGLLVLRFSKQSCHMQFQCAFTAQHYIFKSILLVWAKQLNFSENAILWRTKRMLKQQVATSQYIISFDVTVFWVWTNEQYSNRRDKMDFEQLTSKLISNLI